MSMGWSLPPGVTGHEYQISGPDWEDDQEVQCDAEQVVIHVSLDRERRAAATAKDYVERALSAAATGDADAAARFLRVALPQMAQAAPEQVHLEACPWDGVVTVQGYQGESWWECPVCGAEHTRTREEVES
jgi:hypothetical protein